MSYPKSAILSLVEPCSRPCPSPEKVRRLPSPLTALYDNKNKGLVGVQLSDLCQSAFDALAINSKEVEYLEQATRLQTHSSLWFEHGKGRVTASI